MEYQELKDFVNINHAKVTALESEMKAGTPADKTKLCVIWATASPIVKMLTAIPFLPGKWRDILNALFTGLDSYCNNK